MLFIFKAQALSAEPGIAYTGFGSSDLFSLTPDQSQAIIYSLSLTTYNKDLFRHNKNDDFFSRNFNVEIRSIRSSIPGELLSNGALAINSKLTLLETLKFLGEFESSMPQSKDPQVKAYSLQIGPSITIQNFKIQADYRKMIPRSLNERQGFFFNLDYQPCKQISLGTSADREWTNTDIITHGLFKMTLSPFSFASVVTGMDVADLNSRKNDSLYRTTYSYFANLNNEWKGYTTFINYQLERLDDNQVGPYSDSSTNVLAIGVKKIWTKIETWITTKEVRAEENRHLAELGFNYSPFSSFKLGFENSYERFKLNNNKLQQIITGGINFKILLPLGMEFQNSLRINKAIDNHINYQFMSSIIISKF